MGSLPKTTSFCIWGGNPKRCRFGEFSLSLWATPDPGQKGHRTLPPSPSPVTANPEK
ncbi:hypothetical protein F383_07083 [Gossypium arboreum]|uniref:Uncharacterized protein n=1 Tax=Gossypium arboreum TaxID=29729 RepID=A0A0B0PYW7_GOSAR|nr:hypothetical protein F383_07083 [Gossypium arboreum]